MIPNLVSPSEIRLLLFWGVIGLILIDPVMAHPAGGSPETSHLISEIIGYLVFGFILYVGYQATQQIIYPRLHTLLK